MRKWTLIILSFLLYTCAEPTYETVDGILQVPENRENPNSRTLDLVYKVLKAKKADSLKAPIVFLQGGPGAPTLIMEEFWKNHPLRDDRDIVLMDQRGTGKSGSNCTELGENMFTIMQQDLDPKSEILALKTVITECQKISKEKGVDFAGYNSKENAADFEDLRKILGYGEWNLLGASYGTRLGLTFMRDFPESVRSVVLTGVLAPEINFIEDSIENFENSLFSVLELCEQSKECNNQYPNLKKRLLRTLKKIQIDPLSFDNQGKPFVLNTQDALLVLFVSLYDRNSIGYIPSLIDALENREIEPIRNALKAVESILDFVNWPMNYAVTANEEMPFTDLPSLDMAVKKSEVGYGFGTNSSGMQLLNNWHSTEAKIIEDQPVVSEIPTLMISGGLDHVTPVSNAKESLKYLKNGYEIIFQDDAHNLFNPCFFEISEEFLNNPLQQPNSECSAERKPIEWKLN